MNQNLPNLKIIPATALVLHEEVDSNRIKRLLDRIKKDQVLINPPIVTILVKNKNFIVLDGANRVSALRKIKTPDILVQIINYNDPKIKLDTWNHLILNLKAKDFWKKLSTSIKSTELKQFRLKGNRIICPKIKKNKIEKQIETLGKIVKFYKGKYKFHRLAKNSFEKYNQNQTLIVFPKLKPENIISIVKKGTKIPSGITQHIITGRALRIDLPLEILKKKQPLIKKNKLLKILVKKRLDEDKIRYYREPVYIFDD